MSYIDPAGKVFQHLDRLQALKKGRPLAPINVEIDLSNRCSLGCEWCHFAFTHTRGPLAGKRAKPVGATPGGDLMTYELATGIVEQFKQAGVLSVTWTGGGEPTLHPQFDEIIEFTASRGLPQGIYTHGGHITEARAALLKRAMTFVYVSLDAADPVTYKACKGIDRFAAACDGIRLLAEADGDATVGLGMLVGPGTNLDSIWDAAVLARDLGADYVQYRPIISFDIDNPTVPDEDRAWVESACEAIGKTASLQPVFGLCVEWDAQRFRDYQAWTETGHGYDTCWWSGLQTVVTPNGKMWTCVNKREHPGAETGDLSAETFSWIWRRQQIAKVDGSCRVMCRGHVANKTVDAVMTPQPHAAFV